MTKDLTVGSTKRLLISFCLPLIGGAIFQQLYNNVDSIIVGQFVGVNALAAVGSTGSLNFLILGFALGLTAGCGIPIAQAFGAKNNKLLLKNISNALYIALFFSLLLTLGTYLYTDDLLRIMNTPSNIYKDAYDYIIIIFLGVGATIAYNILASILRALGDSKSPLIFLATSSIMNIILDVVFIVNFKMEVKGAAYATVISQAFSAILCLIYMKYRYKFLVFEKETLSLNFKVINHQLSVSVPMALQYFITAVGAVILQTAVNSLGSNKVAAITAAQKIQLFLTQPMDMMGATMATFSGQNLGAKNLGRIKKGLKEATIMTIIYSFVAYFINLIFGKYLLLLFINSSQTSIINDAVHFLNINGIFYFTLGILFICRNTIQGLGYSLVTMLAGVGELFARAGVAILLVGKFGFNAICFANPLAWIVADIVLIPTIYYVLKLISKQIKLEGEVNK